ncbi:MAG: hypothetical protein IJ422_03710 [Oscillospiraceae bacterium]|nr:hypothetical protein [Oscillospiraceae bacterium]
MDALELVKKLSAHPVVEGSMSMQVQLGLPYLEKRHGKLCVSFLAHREDYRDGKMDFFAPQYKIAWVYPFHKLIAFENCLYYGDGDFSAPVCTLPAERFAGRGRYILLDLYDQCSRVLSMQERDGDVSEVTLRRYQRAYFEAVGELGLEKVYGEQGL